MNRILAATPLFSRTCTRGIASSQVRQVKPDLTNIKKRQAQMQVDDGVPVYLKGGPTDTALYYVTLALVLGGVATSLRAMFKLATDPK